MMKHSIPGFFVLIVVVTSFGCAEDVNNVPAQTGQDHEQPAELALDPAMEFLKEQQLKYEKQLLLKDWKKCQGYLSNNMVDDFCVSEVPEDWTPFEFNSETYYVQPLSVRSD